MMDHAATFHHVLCLVPSICKVRKGPDLPSPGTDVVCHCHADLQVAGKSAARIRAKDGVVVLCKDQALHNARTRHCQGVSHRASPMKAFADCMNRVWVNWMALHPSDVPPCFVLGSSNLQG
jgi:hypothetical protein